MGCRRHAGKTWVEIWDTGIGIPADKTGEIFGEFCQLGDGARNRGSGLGLAIVARTARLLGLEIRVRSRLGEGSLFAIEVPLGAAEDALLPPVAEHGGYRPLCVALVEDNVAVLEALVMGLEAAGNQVIAATTGVELQDKLRGVTPDILVSDYRLARGETGFDVINMVRNVFGGQLPALLLTGDTDPNLVRSMAERDIVILHKPVDLETLKAYLEDLTYSGRPGNS